MKRVIKISWSIVCSKERTRTNTVKQKLIIAMMAAFAIVAFGATAQFSSVVSAEPDKDKHGCYEPRSMAEAESLLKKDCKPHLPKPEISGQVSYDCGNWYVEVEYIETWFGQESRVIIDAPGSANDSVHDIGTDGVNDSGVVTTISGPLPTDAFQVDVALYYDKPFDGQSYVFIGDITEDVVATPNTCPPETGSITVVKDADGGGTESFAFTGGLGGFSLIDDESATFSDLLPGAYNVTELDEAGWDLVNIACVGSATSDTDIGDGDVIVNLEAGEDATCVFTNVALPPPVDLPEPQPTAPPVVIVPDDDVDVDVDQVVNVEAPPAPAPQVIVEREVVVQEVEREVVVQRISPPSTGDGGLK